MSETLVEFGRFSYSFGSHPVLRDVSLTVGAGEFVSLIGPNGAGKTTLLKQVNRLLTGGVGELRVAGRPVAEYRQVELARLIGYVPQAEGRRFPFTVREFVLMGRYPYLSPFTAVGSEDRAAMADALALTDLEDYADRPVATLSGGERQRVLIAGALAQQAKLLLLDEPATFLDPRHQAHVYEILHRVNRDAGVTILAVTHDINAAALSSRRIVALKAGRVVFNGPPREFMDPEVLSELYGMRFVFAPHPHSGQPLVLPEARP